MLGLLFGHPVVLLVAIVVVLTLVASAQRGKTRPRDPRRLFSAAERAILFSRAGNRCEAKRALLPRCRRPAEAGDHIYPWSRGGATSLANGAALCSQCNRRKSARVPSAFYIWRLERRRGKYFPPGQRVEVEWRTLSRPGV